MGRELRIVGVDLGGTKLRAALADGEGHLLTRMDMGTEAEKGPEHVINNIVNLIKRVTKGIPLESVVAVGVAAPGPLDVHTGVVINAPNMPGWLNIPLRERLSLLLNKPVYLDNDANAAAVGEQRFGAGRGAQNLVYITVSTGIGGGIISHGCLIHGMRGLAGEVGHMVIDARGPKCGCGNFGCLEALASGTAIAREAVRLIEAGMPTALTEMANDDLTKITAQLVTRAAEEGDAMSQELLRRAGEYIGIGVVNLLHLFNPEIVIIGGGVSQAGDLVFTPIRETVDQRAMEGYHEGVPVIPSPLGDDVGLYGAIALVLPHLPS